MQDPATSKLADSILDGDSEQAAAAARELLARGTPVRDIVTLGVEGAMSALDGKCTLERFNLLEIMLAGRAVMQVMHVLFPPGAPMPGNRGTVVVGTLEGDVHDLGKSVLKMVLTGKGYRVVDCGRSCPLDVLAARVREERPIAVGISGLVTSVIPNVQKVRPLLRCQGMGDVKVVAGGAALKQSSAEKLDVDFLAQSAFDCVHYLESLVLPGTVLRTELPAADELPATEANP